MQIFISARRFLYLVIMLLLHREMLAEKMNKKSLKQIGDHTWMKISSLTYWLKAKLITVLYLNEKRRILRFLRKIKHEKNR